MQDDDDDGTVGRLHCSVEGTRHPLAALEREKKVLLLLAGLMNSNFLATFIISFPVQVLEMVLLIRLARFDPD